MVAFEHPHPHGALAPTAHLELPFFDDVHRALANGLVTWAREQRVDERDDRAACREWVQRLGGAGWLRYCVSEAHGGVLPRLDSRALVILRETLAYHSPLADFAFAMQGLGSGALSLAGTPEQQARYLPAVARGEKIAAFALSEPDAGSDVAAMATRADTGGQRLGAQRQQDLDQQWRPGRLLPRVRQDRPRGRFTRHQRLRGGRSQQRGWTAANTST